jgi:hypothetical protein
VEAVFRGDTKILVESDGELLLVDKYLNFVAHYTFDFADRGVYSIELDSAVRFVVFRLDENEKKWVELTSLGGKVLFLGEDCAFSVFASDLCMGNGNCIIFRDNVYHYHHLPWTGIDVFCLDNNRISPLSDLPCYSNLFWPPPQWVGLL